MPDLRAGRGEQKRVDVNKKLLIVGLDGATFDLILPWAKAGGLPHMADLLHQGSWGPLASTVPPASFPAWSTLMTGANPGRHGIFDFSQRIPASHRLTFVNSTFRRLPSLWQLLSRAGRRVGVMGFPATYPPEPVNGFLISGFDSPLTTGVDRRFVYPRALYREITPYPLTGIQEVRIGPGWHAQALRQLLWAIERRTEIALMLLNRESWDLFAVHYGASDTVAHHFWAFHDRDSPRYDPIGAEQFGDAILRIYKALDRALGQMLQRVDSNTVVAVVSDHGSGGSGEWIVHLNRWLEQGGWLRFEGTGAGPSVSKGLRWLGLRLPAAWQQWAFRGPLRRWVHRFVSWDRFAGIDWERTVAFSEEVNTLPGIWLNVGTDEHHGERSTEEYERLRTELCTALEAWCHPETGSPIVQRAWRREDLYQGPWVHLAPDIVLELALDRGYTMTCLSSGGHPGQAFRKLTAEERLGFKGGSMNGSHRPEGILLLHGAGVRQNATLAGAGLADIAPTALALLGTGIPPGLDGRALNEAFSEGFLRGQTIPDEGPAPAPPQAYGEHEIAVVRERLRGMGYRE